MWCEIHGRVNGTTGGCPKFHGVAMLIPVAVDDPLKLPSCGCYIDTKATPIIRFCPLHANAGRLLEDANEVVHSGYPYSGFGTIQVSKDALAKLALTVQECKGGTSE